VPVQANLIQINVKYALLDIVVHREQMQHQAQLVLLLSFVLMGLLILVLLFVMEALMVVGLLLENQMLSARYRL